MCTRLSTEPVIEAKCKITMRKLKLVLYSSKGGVGTPATPALAEPLFGPLMGVVNINLLISTSEASFSLPTRQLILTRRPDR